jgi:hypothetical protein
MVSNRLSGKCQLRDEKVRKAVRKTYGDIAKGDSAGCGCGPSSCCGEVKSPSAQGISVRLDYSDLIMIF